jgi:hypothetical protein
MVAFAGPMDTRLPHRTACRKHKLAPPFSIAAERPSHRSSHLALPRSVFFVDRACSRLAQQMATPVIGFLSGSSPGAFTQFVPAVRDIDRELLGLPLGNSASVSGSLLPSSGHHLPPQSRAITSGQSHPYARRRNRRTELHGGNPRNRGSRGNRGNRATWRSRGSGRRHGRNR